MDLALSLVAILIAVAALGLVLGLRNQVAQIPRVDPRADLERLKQELTEVRHDIDHAQHELQQLKAATEIAPAPPPLPLPRARSVGLSDLREQLRAAHREPDPDAEE